MSEKRYSGFSPVRLIWNNLRARPVRSALSIVAIALQVFLILLIVGLSAVVVHEWGQRGEVGGADILVQPPHSCIIFGFASAGMQESVGDKMSRVEGVDEVA